MQCNFHAIFIFRKQNESASAFFEPFRLKPVSKVSFSPSSIVVQEFIFSKFVQAYVFSIQGFN